MDLIKEEIKNEIENTILVSNNSEKELLLDYDLIYRKKILNDNDVINEKYSINFVDFEETNIRGQDKKQEKSSIEIDIEIVTLFKDKSKLELLKKANDILNITKSPLNKIIFIYTHPKVGSTSLVTSIRMFASHHYNVIHIHDEEMLKKLSNINYVSINEIIYYNKFIGKDVYVIDVYRSPIERKISTFFEKIDSYHFNNSCSNINLYGIDKLINRFNKIYPHIGNGDHFMDTYDINLPYSFNFDEKYLHVKEKGINYIKLRLKDSELWDDILSKLLNIKIKIVKDYETSNKAISLTYLKFKEVYKIPINYLEELDNCMYLNYFYNETEKEGYFNEWSNKVDKICMPFNSDEYKIYEYISFENKYMEDVQTKHYLDEGCLCKACYLKRIEITNRIMKGENVKETIIHENVRNEFILKRIDSFTKIKNKIIKNKEINNKRSSLDMKLL